MKQLNIIALNPDDFKKSLIQEIKNHLKSDSSSDELLTRQSTADLLKISLTTLWNWTKNNKVQSYGIGNKVYYKKNEIMDKLVQLNKAI